VVALRREACEKRKADAAARREVARAENAKIAAAAKEAKEAEKQAAAEAKEKTKAKAASQAQYNAVWNAHQGLVAAVEKVPSDEFGSDAYLKATEKVEEGETLIEQCLDALKLKISVPSDPIKAYIQSLKHILSEAQKLGGKKRQLKK
jgi:biotin carboxyl carrier protein